jgi:hypothetical protein
MMKQSESDKEKFLYESYGEGINDALAADPERTFRLIHRAHQADIDMIKKTFTGLNPKCRLDFSYKYSVAQMYSSAAPQYIYESQFLEHIGNSKFFLTVREDAWYNLRGGSDPAFARAYFKNIPKNNFEGFYTGPDGYTPGREYISRTPGSPRQLVLKKRWYSFRILGKLAYDPETPDTYFTEIKLCRWLTSFIMEDHKTTINGILRVVQVFMASVPLIVLLNVHRKREKVLLVSLNMQMPF